MSKIQDAIRKLKSSKPTEVVSPKGTESVAQPVATIRHQQARMMDDTQDENRTTVNLDYELLRQSGLLAPSGQQRHIADQYRLIKRPLLDNVAGRSAHQSADANLIMVASALPGDGKTFNCINLALSIATEKDTSVLLVDADVAKPHISRLFGIDSEPGLIELLKDDSRNIGDLLLPTNVPGLRLLPAGRPDEHATELLASKRMADVVNVLSRRFPDRVVIFDSPPLLVTSEARVLASRMGQIVLVVCSGVTPQHAVLDAVESLNKEMAISIVLNQSGRGFGSNGYGGYGGYGYGSDPGEQR